MKQVSGYDFVQVELRGAGIYFNERTLPDLMDGLKTGQRKIIATAIEIAAGQEIKVSSLGGRVVDKMAYHHGDAALQETIVKLAQGFPGSNNVPFMDALGSFGTSKKREGSAPRYISTRLSKAFHAYFDKRDQKVVTHLYDDGEQIEPRHYIPMIPTILVNGAHGVATGYSSKIGQYNPKDIKRALLELCKTGAVGKPLQPWLNGYTGKITKDNATGQISYHGVIEVATKTKIMITELPPKYDLLKFKEHMNELIEKDVIKDYTNQSGTGHWKFEVQCTREFTDNHTEAQLLEKLGLVERMTENIVCWNVDGTIGVFPNVEALLAEWYNQRLKYSGLALSNVITEMEEELLWLRVKRLFIAWWNDHAEEVVKMSKQEIEKRIVTEVSLLGQHPNYMTRLLDIRILNLAKDETEMLTRHITEKTQGIAAMRAFTPASWYQSNLEGDGLG